MKKIDQFIEVLTGARALIGEYENWTIGREVRIGEKGVPSCYCIEGAIFSAAGMKMHLSASCGTSAFVIPKEDWPELQRLLAFVGWVCSTNEEKGDHVATCRKILETPLSDPFLGEQPRPFRYNDGLPVSSKDDGLKKRKHRQVLRYLDLSLERLHRTKVLLREESDAVGSGAG